MRKIINVFLFCAVLLFTAGVTLAGEIIGVMGVSGPGLQSSGTSSLPLFTFAPNNDNDSLGIDNFGTYDISFGSTDYVDVEIVVSNTGGVTEYSLSGFMRNKTPDTWDKFEFILGFGTGGTFSTASLGDLDFDTPHKDPAVQGTNLTQIVHTSGLIQASAGIGAPPNHLEDISYAIDIPDNLPSDKFTIRHVPMPEPAGVALMLLGGLGLIQRRH